MNELLSGEYGPRFIGYAEEPKLTLWQRWRGTIAIAAVISLAALVIGSL